MSECACWQHCKWFCVHLLHWTHCILQSNYPHKNKEMHKIIGVKLKPSSYTYVGWWRQWTWSFHVMRFNVQPAIYSSLPSPDDLLFANSNMICFLVTIYFIRSCWTLWRTVVAPQWVSLLIMHLQFCVCLSLCALVLRPLGTSIQLMCIHLCW